ncbi:MAG TPA: hypothetical protein VF516_12655 [Kofleriaceae bacterium]
MQLPAYMRITTSPVCLVSFGSLVSLGILGALAAPARAEHKDAGKSRERIAAAAAEAVRTERGGASLTTGELGLTGARAARRGMSLEAGEVAAEVRPYAPDIERCYLDRLGDVSRAGRLDLTFVIGRDGYVVSLDAAAPGLPARTVRQMAICIREAVDAIHFPERRADTTAVVPYYFQHTNTPGGGPQLSCWNPKGCH